MGLGAGKRKPLEGGGKVVRSYPRGGVEISWNSEFAQRSRRNTNKKRVKLPRIPRKEGIFIL